jgi:uncharacterized protein (DUF433 family)
VTAEPAVARDTPRERARWEAYSFADVDRLARTPRGTARYWLRTYGGNRSDAASFDDLIEVAAVALLREHSLKPAQIAHILRMTAEALGVDRPVTSLAFKLRPPELPETGAAQDAALAPLVERLDYENGWAVQWWPAGRDEPVRVHPDYGWGFPTLGRTGMRTEVLFEAYESGEPVADIARNYPASAWEIERAVAFERALRA